jgi:hypothetical protein
MEVSGHLHDPAALPPGKEPLVPIAQEAEWAPEPVSSLKISGAEMCCKGGNKKCIQRCWLKTSWEKVTWETKHLGAVGCDNVKWFGRLEQVKYKS